MTWPCQEEDGAPCFLCGVFIPRDDEDRRWRILMPEGMTHTDLQTMSGSEIAEAGVQAVAFCDDCIPKINLYEGEHSE